MKQFRKLTWAVIASMSLFTACSNVDDEEDGPQDPTTEAGTEAKPFSVAEVIAKNPGATAVATGVWAEGYIVGVRDHSQDPAVDVFGKQDAYGYDANVYLADTEGETNYKNCINVQVVFDFQAKLGLKSNPGNYGKKIAVKGDIIKYNGVAGIRNTNAYILDGQKEELPEPEVPETGDVEVCGDAATAVASLSYDFNDITNEADFSKEGWKSIIVSGDRQWRGTTFEGNGYIKATAYGGKDGVTYESWVISPALDLTKAASKVVSFKTAQAFMVEGTIFEVYALQCVDGKTVKTALKANLAPTVEGEKYVFYESGNVDLSHFSGVVYIGFRYNGQGGKSKSGTWCVDDFQFGTAASQETTVAIKYGTASAEINTALNCEITTTVTNANGTTTITAEGIPAWATFTDNGNGTAAITGTAPATAEQSTVTIKAANNGVEASKTFTLKVFVPTQPGELANGGFEAWSGTTPDFWSFKAVSGVEYTKETSTIKEGVNAVKVISGPSAGTAGISADRIILEPGDYTYSFDYYLDPAVTVQNTFRSWGMIYDDMSATSQSTNKAFDAMKKSLQPAAYVPAGVKGEWASYSTVFTVPANCCVVFEVRVYKGTTGYVDNVSLIKK